MMSILEEIRNSLIVADLFPIERAFQTARLHLVEGRLPWSLEDESLESLEMMSATYGIEGLEDKCRNRPALFPL